MRRPVPLVVLPLAVTAAVLLGGCGGSSTTEGGRSGCTKPSAAADTSALPDDLDLTSLGTVTATSGSGDSLSAVVVIADDAKTTVDSVASLVEDAGWKVTKRENEDREGEVFFEKAGKSGVARADTGDCEAQTVVEVTVTGG